jgi:Tol biopolymer transport system component
MGEVWRGKDTRLDRSVAVKILPSGFAEDAERRQRFEREAKTISSLNHAHICTLFDVGREDDSHFLVMELLEGESLAERLQKGPLPLDQVVKFGAQVADALSAAHKQGIVHRDLKPGNVMLTKAGAKLLDFGLARSGAGLGGVSGSTALPTEAKPLTSVGTVLGTFQYMAPEQLEGEEAGPRTDIFALGALLYEMATARRAFEGKSKTSLIAAILSSQPPPISQVVPVMPPALDHVVKKCLEKDPDDRWQSAQDVASELRWIAEAGSQAGVPATLALRRKSRERLAWGLAAILGLTALVLGIVALRRAPQPTRAVRATLEPPQGFSLVPFDELGIALSPDGRQLAFVAIAGDGSKQVFVRDLAEMTARVLPGTGGAWYPFWSPDGRHLGFFADGKLKRIDLRGGAPQAVADAPSGRGGSWGRGDVILFTPSVTSGIHRVAATGGAVVPVTRNDTESETSHRWPHWLPDGRQFLYMLRARVSRTSEVGRLMLGSLDSPQGRLLVEDATNAVYVEPGYLIYGRAASLYARRFDAAKGAFTGEPVPIVQERLSFWAPKNLVVFAASASGTLVYLPEAVPKTTLRWYDDDGRPLAALGGPAYHWSPRISPDGSKVAFVSSESGGAQASPSSDVWITDLQYQRTFRLTQKSASYGGPAWSWDSSRLVFSCQPRGVQDLCARSLRESGEVESILESPNWKEMGSFLPDGRSLLFAEQDPQSSWDLKVVALDEKKEPRVLHSTPSEERYPEISPDGRWVAYRSNETGRFEIVVRPLLGSYEQWQVSAGGGNQPRWRGDGRELYYAAPDGYLMAVSIETRPVFRPGAPRRLFPLPERPDRDAPIFEDVMPDGTRFLLNVPIEARSSVGFHLVVNWRSLVEARGE